VNSWAHTTIGDFAPFLYGKGLPEKERNSAGSVLVYGSNGVVGKHDAAHVLNRGIVVGRKGTIGSVHYSDVPFWGSSLDRVG
jgi:type I restriction enzyme S subunit